VSLIPLFQWSRILAHLTGGVKEFALARELAFEADYLVAELEDHLVLLADVKLEMGVVFLQSG
jgi:hypothetical protein